MLWKKFIEKIGFHTCENIPSYEMDDGAWGYSMLFWIILFVIFIIFLFVILL